MPAWGEPWGDPWGTDLTTREESGVATVPYILEADADLYFAERLGTAKWDSAGADKTPALQQATRFIDTLCFVGARFDETQIREFPRDVTDQVTVLGQIPETVKQATAEVALAFLKGFDAESLTSKAGVTSEKVGDASRAFGKMGRSQIIAQNDGLPSPTASRLLREWMCDPQIIDLDRVG